MTTIKVSVGLYQSITAKRDQHHHAVHHRFEKRQRQRALDRIDRAEARHDVADVALLKPRKRQAQQPREQRVEQLQVQPRADVHAEPGAQPGNDGDHHCQQSEADAEHRQQVAIAPDDNAIDHQLQEERRRDRQHFQHQRQQQHLRDRTLQSGGRTHQLPRADLFALVALLEPGGRRHLHRHAGVMVRRFGDLQHAPPARRIVDRDRVAVHVRQHDKMVHVPVQDRRQLQLRQRLERDLDSARGHSHHFGDRADVLQRDALHRRREPHSHAAQISAETVITGDHRDARDAALGRFALQNHRHAPHYPSSSISRAFP